MLGERGLLIVPALLSIMFSEILIAVSGIHPVYDVKIVLGNCNAMVAKEEMYMPTIGKHRKHNIMNDNEIHLYWREAW